MRRAARSSEAGDALPDSLSPGTMGTAAAPSSLGSDAARTVFGFAPLWVHSATWHCRHPDSSNEQSYLDTMGPNSAEEVSRLYRNRQMKGSNLVVGLAQDALPGDNIPAAFFRTLGYIFEMAKSGMTYHPVTAADLQRGSPDPGWCPPLWQDQPRSSHPSDAGTVPQAAVPSAGSTNAAPSAAERLLASAPFWCYLYNHEPSRSKKTPPKTSEEMIAALRSDCLPDWAPLVGLGKDVATFNSLPPCLFMTLGSLTNLAAAGSVYRPVGLGELNRYDKFFNSRTKWGSTQGVLQPGPQTVPHSHSAPAAPSQPLTSLPSFPSSSRVSAAGLTPPPPQPHHFQSSAMYALQQQQQSGPNFMPYNPVMPNPMMWYGNYGGYMPGQVYAGLPLPPGTVLSEIDVGERTSAPEPLRRTAERSASGNIPLRLSCPLPEERRMGVTPSRSASHQADEAGAGGWQTSVFRLFMAGSVAGPPQGHWWLLVPGPVPGATISGPLGPEEIILHYASGRLHDHHYVCGAALDVPGYLLSSHQFEPIGKLLQQQVGNKAGYVLHTAGEFMATTPEEQQTPTGAQQAGRGFRGSRGGSVGPAGPSTRRVHKSLDGQSPNVSAGGRGG